MAFVSLPEQVTIAPSSIPGVQLGVFSTCWIKEGTQMGPYTGQIVKLEEVNYDVDNNLMWEVKIKYFFLTPSFMILYYIFLLALAGS